ncbi:DEAD/DEAH box helicase [Parvularcula sp. ZS-1/3]|uniref:DEAD/DEAH box helicase n=1 Tax=Parvularcula mediterranea TaxID=2732508 RepID=A0A7Y3RII5_9PROT|nr:DEAD/DEAH box helicase [Parvularcula mediterranea]NNU14725.1 DEAD/DEAH box helicase [Parvularcula mediterranea]
MNSFDSFGLAPSIVEVLKAEGYSKPTPIQEQTFPLSLEGHDILGIAQTGTGKTLGFAAPIITKLLKENVRPEKRSCRALVLAPTRELAAQIADSFKTYAGKSSLSVVVAFGGVKINPQRTALARGVDILVATPGRLEDLIAQKFLTLDHVSHLVLDEADQMLDLGFIHSLRRIAKLVPPQRQTMLFSATMPKTIRDLAGGFLTDPKEVSVAPQSSTAEKVEQSAYFVKRGDKPRFVADILRRKEVGQVIVFTRTKHGADKLVRHLAKEDIDAAALHGNKTQGQRQRALGAFREKKLNVLVATDIAARGIDISGLGHVINFELPNVPEQYVHRIGRTGRADRDGNAISLVSGDEKSYLRGIEKLIRQDIPVLPVGEGYEDDLEDLPPPKQGGGGQRQNPRRQGGRGKPQGQAQKQGQKPARGGRGRRPRKKATAKA